MRVVFLGTPDYAAIPLRALAHDPRYELVGVVTQPNRPAGRGRTLVPPPVKLTADELGIPVLQPATLRDPAAIAQLADWQPQVGVVAAYGEILRKAVLGIPPLGYLNIHPSLLPRYRGPTPVPAAILGGDATTGVTVMLLDAKMDSGPILAQHALPLAPDARAGTLTRTLFELGAQMLLEALAGYASGVCVPTPQDEAQASYCPMLHKHDGLIDWRAPAAQIERMTRAYDPWPGAQTLWRGQPFKIIAARADTAWAGQATPGTLLLRPAAAMVATGTGALELITVQPAGKPPITAAAWRHGLHDADGARLGL